MKKIQHYNRVITLYEGDWSWLTEWLKRVSNVPLEQSHPDVWRMRRILDDIQKAKRVRLKESPKEVEGGVPPEYE